MTIKDCLNRAAEDNPNGVALRYRRDGQWETRSYGALRERVWHVAQMLVTLGVVEGDRVAIYRENSPEWYELYFGIVGIGAVAVPVDIKLREQEVAHIVHDCGVSVIFASSRQAEALADMSEQTHSLRAIILLDRAQGRRTAHETVDCHDYDALREEVSAEARMEGRAFDQRSPEECSPASIIYTSGTTGRPKGAVLTHRNFIANVESVQKAIPFFKEDNLLLILPLHHSFAFTTSLLIPVYIQCQVTLVDSLKTLTVSMAQTSPTVMLAVPLLLEKMLGRIMESINANKTTALMYRIGLGRMIGRRVKAGLGGALRLVVSGGAPISPSTLKAWSSLGFCIVEGYGITETAPVLSVNPPGAARVGTVGRPLVGVEIRIKDPNSEGVGEIIARGENVMQGYYNNPEETEKVLVDGWYHTGDLGYLDKKGYLVVSGRKKSLIVNREGKNIYPEEVEQQVAQSRYVLECLAMGYCEVQENIGERVGLIVVPDLAVFDAMEEVEGRRISDREIEKTVREDICRQLDALSDYKRPRRIEIRFDEFEKTTTQKIKRHLYAINPK